MYTNLNNHDPLAAIATLQKETLEEKNPDEEEKIRLNLIFQEMITYMQTSYSLPIIPEHVTYSIFLSKTRCFQISASKLDETLLDYLLSLGGDINQLDSKNNNALFYACEILDKDSNMFERVQKYIKKLLLNKCNPLQINFSKVCPLEFINSYKLLDAFEIKNLLKQMPSDMISNASGLLHRTSDIEIINFLIAKGCDINICDIYGRTPLYCALERGDLNVVEQLLNMGANFKITLPYKEMAEHKIMLPDPIEMPNTLSARGQFNQLKEQFEKSKNEIEFEPISVNKEPITSKAIELFKILINRGWDINRPDADGNTPLILLSKCFFNLGFSICNTNFIMELVELDASLTQQNNAGECAIEFLSANGGFHHFQIKLFFQYINEGLFNLIARTRSNALLDFFFSINRSIDEKDGNGNDLLMATCNCIGSQNLPDIDLQNSKTRKSRKTKTQAHNFIERLIKSGFDYFKKNYQGESGVELFIKNGIYNDPTMVKFLSDFDQSQFSELAHIIHITQSPMIIELFVNKGIWIDLPDSNGFTLLHKAVMDLDIILNRNIVNKSSANLLINKIAELVKLGADPLQKTLCIGEHHNDTPLSALELLKMYINSNNCKELKIIHSIFMASRKVCGKYLAQHID
ncbi:MAG: ankyrin repeat domain-containing protein [Parachlamydiaceae bacterium]|nr:ankyrin repeat domain-containing protein [Parachlamydiaceae bacterium]